MPLLVYDVDYETVAENAYFDWLERSGFTPVQPAQGLTEVTTAKNGRVAVRFENCNGRLATVRLNRDGTVHDIR